MVHAGCVLVDGIHLSRTWMSGSFESLGWNACVHRLDLGLYSHPKEFVGMESEPMLGGRNSSVGSAWARCPQRRGSDPPLETFSVEGIFPLELTWVQTPFPQKLLRMRV